MVSCRSLVSVVLHESCESAMAVTGFHHTGVTVRDMDRMLRFYSEELGLEVFHDLQSTAPAEGDHTGIPGARRRLVFVGFPDDHQIELVQYLDPPASEGHLDRHQLGSSHVCFRVDDLEATCTTLQKRGVAFLTEPYFREIDGRRVGVVYAQDPELNWIEFIEGL